MGRRHARAGAYGQDLMAADSLGCGSARCRKLCSVVRPGRQRWDRCSWSRGVMTTARTSTAPSTSTGASSATDSFTPSVSRRRTIRMSGRVAAIVVAGVIAGVGVHSLTGEHSARTVAAVADPNVAVVYSTAGQVAGQRAADAATDAMRDPIGQVLFGAAWNTPGPSVDATAQLLFGGSWPVTNHLVATIDGQAALLDLIFSPVAP